MTKSKLPLFIATLWSSILSAGQADLTTLASPLEEITTIAERLPAISEKSALSMSQINNDELKHIAQNHVQEALVRVPGVSFQRGNGQEYLPAIRSPILTGAGACGAFLILQDGIPLRSSGFCNLNELFSAHTEQAQSIEVLRGPAPAAYGSNALHGLINVITVDTNNNKHHAGVEFGENNFARLKVRQSVNTGAHQFGGNLTLTHDGGFREMADYDQQKINLYHETELANLSLFSGVSFSNLNQETAGFIRGFESYQEEHLVKSNPTPEAFRDVRYFNAWTKIKSLPDNGKQWEITPYIRDTDMVFLQHFLPGDPLEKNGHTSIGVQTNYAFSASETIRVLSGIDAEYTQGYLKQTQALPTKGSPFLVATIPTGTHYDYKVDATMLAAFVDVNWSISSQWHLGVGVRLESQHYDYDNLSLDGRTRDDGTECGFGGCRYSRPGDRKDSFSNISPKINLRYLIADNHMVYANVMHGFRAPQTSELYRLQRQQQIAELDSEEVRSIELGVRGTLGTFNYELVSYNINKENVIFRDTDFFNVSHGKTKHQGIEAALQYAITPSLKASINANYARHSYDNDQILNEVNINGNDIDTAPRYFGGAQLAWHISSTFNAEIEWVHMGRYYLDPENLNTYEGHDLANLRLSKTFDSGYRVHARILNITDKPYAERADFTSFTQHRYFPGEPRSFFFGLEKTW